MLLLLSAFLVAANLSFSESKNLGEEIVGYDDEEIAFEDEEEALEVQEIVFEEEDDAETENEE